MIKKTLESLQSMSPCLPFALSPARFSLHFGGSFVCFVEFFPPGLLRYNWHKLKGYNMLARLTHTVT